MNIHHKPNLSLLVALPAKLVPSSPSVCPKPSLDRSSATLEPTLPANQWLCTAFTLFWMLVAEFIDAVAIKICVDTKPCCCFVIMRVMNTDQSWTPGQPVHPQAKGAGPSGCPTAACLCTRCLYSVCVLRAGIREAKAVPEDWFVAIETHLSQLSTRNSHAGACGSSWEGWWACSQSSEERKTWP